MINEWRKRLAEILEKNGRSARSVSIDAGKGAGYVHSILKEGKDPTIESLNSVCIALNVSLSKVLYGVNLSPEGEELLSLLEEKPDMTHHILEVLRRR